MKHLLLLFLVPLMVSNVLLSETPQANAYFSEFEATEEENSTFRNIVVEGNKGVYTVKGEAKTKKDAFYYTVEDGHHLYVDETRVSSGTEWSPFEIRVEIAKDKLPENATLILHLYEKDETGGNINSLPVVLEAFYK